MHYNKLRSNIFPSSQFLKYLGRKISSNRKSFTDEHAVDKPSITSASFSGNMQPIRYGLRRSCGALRTLLVKYVHPLGLCQACFHFLSIALSLKLLERHVAKAYQTYKPLQKGKGTYTLISFIYSSWLCQLRCFMENRLPSRHLTAQS